jgi:hypothetical protein
MLGWLFNFLNPTSLKDWRNFVYDLPKGGAA